MTGYYHYAGREDDRHKSKGYRPKRCSSQRSVVLLTFFDFRFSIFEFDLDNWDLGYLFYSQRVNRIPALSTGITLYLYLCLYLNLIASTGFPIPFLHLGNFPLPLNRTPELDKVQTVRSKSNFRRGSGNPEIAPKSLGVHLHAEPCHSFIW